LATVAIWGAAPAAASASPRTSRDRATALRERWGVNGRCVVMYAGNAGLVHDFAAVLEAMRRLADDRSIHFLFIGGGPRRAEIEAFAAAHHLGNFSYHPYVGREAVGDALAAGDIHLITLMAPFAGIAVPGKLYGIMGAARPALFVGPAACETADAIRDAGAGVVIDPVNDEAADRVVAEIRHWRDDPEAAREAGRRGLAAFVRLYQREPNCAAFAAVIAERWPHLAPSASAAAAAGAA